VLVADSSDAARLPCVKYLNLLGFAVDQAVSGSEVLAKLEKAAPHVMLVESGLPNAPISQIVDELKKAAKAIPVIVMTSDLGVLAHGAAALPYVAVLEKPFSLSIMVEEIRRLLRERTPIPAQLPVYSL
jgi:DNA-binding response OmpR family regulator